MKAKAIVLSGRAYSGKSTLAKLLAERRRDCLLVRSKAVIEVSLSSVPRDAAGLAKAARRLEADTKGGWLTTSLNEKLLSSAGDLGLVVIDAVESAEQVLYLRRSGWSVTHVHLQASESELEKRSLKNQAGRGRLQTSKAVTRPKAIDALADIADVVVDTDRCSADDVFARVIARMEVRPVTAVPLVDVMIGGQYGSEGKGNIAHYLAPEYDVLVRVGGPNAGHKVFRSGEHPYTFHQLPSGALANRDATLVIGAGAVISLERLLKEIAELSINHDKLIIDPQAMIINNEVDIAWEVAHLKNAIGSTAQGVGSATARKILYRRSDSNVVLAKDVPALKHYIRDSVEYFAECLSVGRRIMLEGTQGTSLSLHHGSYPHVTSRVTTAAGSLAEAGLSARHVRRVIMVCRTYPIRVGDTDTGNTSGPMSQQITIEQISERSGIPLEELKITETTSTTHRPRRIAEFDWAQFRRSLILNAPTDIALTFADYFGVDNRKAYRYEQLTTDTLRFIEEAEKVGGVPVSMISTAFNDRNIIDRRMW
ncbi:Adenylosuccinate synthetase, organellar chromatophore [Cupriavidus laharis]|uniref:Adenylosuccinate synthetase n=1 Tax=Cupriavidus laharis TaxID=151654 RepID=A0ABN7Z1X1_9BURK|nr:adenylosuccinate synthetase [Cupriavidus laharis]CAG9179968.1 Adenylosuccinate synthetase, organellar chromatophore [Cupriavidus laharis]